MQEVHVFLIEDDANDYRRLMVFDSQAAMEEALQEEAKLLWQDGLGGMPEDVYDAMQELCDNGVVSYWMTDILQVRSLS